MTLLAFPRSPLRIIEGEGRMKRILTLVVSLALLLLVPLDAAAANARSGLHGSVPPWATPSNRAGAANPNDAVNFRVYLGLRDGAEAYALAVSNPRSASYGRYLTPDAFNARFAPSASDVNAVSAWLQSQGLTADYVPSNNHYVAASGTVGQVQAAFGTTLNL